VNIHNIFGFILLGNFLLWAIYYLVTRKLKIYIPDPNLKNFVLGALKQARYYGYGIFVGEPNPHHATPDNKFNPMQKSAYMAIMFVLMPLVALSGILLTNVSPLREIVILVGGLKILVAVHFLLACCLIAFLFTHVYLATLGKTPMAYIKPMWTGWEEEEPNEHPHHSA